MSSLAAQLAQSASLNTTLLVDRSRRKAGESYLFTGREADQHDLESIHALGINGLLQLASLNPALRELEDQLFSEYAKTTDRTLLSAEANAELDRSIAACLALLGPYLMETPTGKILEWLVRRFRINEFNVEALLSLFLPYHESPHFTKMVTILHIKPNSTWSFLLAYKSAAQSLPRMSLVTEMLRNSDIARLVTSLLPTAMKEGFSHRVLLAFNAACLHDFILRSRALDEGTLAYLLPALLEPLQHVPNVKDAILGSYILISALSQKSQIAPPALKTIISTMTSCAGGVSPMQFTNAVLAVCEQQPPLERFSDGTVKGIIRISGIAGELKNACSWVGVEKLICPLLPGLGKRLEDEKASSLLEAIISAPNLPALVMNQSASMLLAISVATKITPASTSARRLLSIIQQRHPSALQEAAQYLIELDETLKESVEQLIVSLSVVQGITGVVDNSSKNGVDMIIASTNADSKVRAIAVKNLVSTLSDQHLNTSSLGPIHSALLARVQDTNQGVVDALYEQPTVIAPVLVAHSQTYLENVSNTLTTASSKPKRSLLRAHLIFIASHFLPASSSHVDSVFHQILFPFMLFSKPRQHTAEVVWDVISTLLQKPDSAKGAAHEWLAGCSAIVESEKENVDVDPIERMGSINTAIAAQISRNILKSNSYSVHFEALVKKLQDISHHARVLGYMITVALLRLLSGEHQLDAAHKALDAMGIEELSGIEDVSLQTQNLSHVIDQKSLGKIAVMKPSSRSTSQWMQISIIALVPTIPPPTGVILDWLTCSSTNPSDQRGPRYVGLMRKVYKLANASTSVPHLTLHLLQALFDGLKEDTLAFLAGIWTSPRTSDHSNVVALRHASAFLQAHISEKDGIDFQTILPSLIVAAQSQDKAQREAALICITHLGQLAEGRFSTVYKFDVIYGQSKSQLQYLDRDDFKKYLDVLIEHGDHLVHDVDYIKTLHQLHLGTRKGDKRRQSEYKYRVLCYILSHINSTTLNDTRIILLKTLSTVSNSAKANLLHPTIQALITTHQSVDGDSPLSQELVGLLISCFDTSVVNDLNDTQSNMWDVFTAVLCKLFTSAQHSSRLILSRSLEQGLFVGLKVERKIALCNLLLDISSHDADTYAACKQLLGGLIQEASLIVQLLDSLQPNSTGTPSRANKRAKLVDTPDDSHQRLSLFVEVLGTRSLPGSLDLISHLLETLNRVVQSVSSTQADVSYIEQLLMSAIENAANKITEIPNLSPSVVRLDILVELIRVSGNPQTFHQALLLMANLARLAPDSVLHNVMPVFTFMGSNIFHRDDTYSFRVVQQTIDSIVPVMVASLKSVHRRPLDLYVGSKEFLRVFTDAANHIPRHRRTNFFAHLVNVLGSDDFLPPVSMLLIEKVANRVVRQSNDDIQSSLALALSVLQQSPLDLQIQTLTEILYECQRLTMRVLLPNTIEPMFLDVSLDDEHATASTILRRRAQALLIFVGYSLKPSASESGSPSHDEHMSQLVMALITLATLQEGTGADTKIEDISVAARSSISRALGVMSVMDFMKAVLSMIESSDKKIQAGALDLLSERLSSVSTKTRQDIVPTINNIVVAIQKLLTTQADGVLVSSAFRAIRSIGLTLCLGEESSITTVIPQILGAVKAGSAASSALAALSPLPIKLGPRIIPYFREVIFLSVAMLREGSPEIMEDTYSVLHGLLSSIPTFWGVGELNQVITLYVDHCVSTANAPSSPMSSLMKAVAKRASPTALLPMMVEMWTTLKVTPDLDRIAPYFDILTRAIRSATRPAVLEQLRPLFNIFVDSFDIAKVSSGKSHNAETCTIMAFKELVVKLNEAAFRPLFRRLYDWAFADKSTDIARKITFCHICDVLLDFFKGLMNPYMSFLLEPFAQSLESFHAGNLDNQVYWTGIIQTLTKSFMFDDGVFWRDDKLRQMSSPLIEQAAVCIKLNYTDGKTQLQECLGALTDSATDDNLLKAINLGLLMHTRSEDARLRLLALTCSEALWRLHGGKLLGFVAETATFIAECSEDDNDMIVRESFKLKDAVESVAGNINGL